MVMCFHFYPEVGGWLLSECLSFLLDSQFSYIVRFLKLVAYSNIIFKIERLEM